MQGEHGRDGAGWHLLRPQDRALHAGGSVNRRGAGVPSASVGGRQKTRRVTRSALEGHMGPLITSGWMEDKVTAGAVGTVPRGLAGARAGQGPEHLAAVGQTRTWHLQRPWDTG